MGTFEKMGRTNNVRERKKDDTEHIKGRETSSTQKEAVEKWMKKDWNTLNPHQKREVLREMNARMKRLTGEMIEHYQHNDICLTKEGRIDPWAYGAGGNKERIKNDMRAVSAQEERFRRKKESTVHRSEDEIFADICEKLLPVIFTKCAPDRFIVVRSAKYDDYYHKIDNVIVDRKTGRVVCTVDEHTILGGSMTTTTDERKMGGYERKKFRRILDMNLNGTTGLSYSFRKTDGNRFVPHFDTHDSPLCMVTIDRKRILKVVSDMGSSLQEISGEEKELFRHFAKSIHDFLDRIVREGERMKHWERKGMGRRIQHAKEFRSVFRGYTRRERNTNTTGRRTE